ncbi:MAG TPA: PilZ domain-containing protein [Terriglobales bacterium]|nr:PilZ domain-containing protein [Terriglobales bacterium]
MKYPSERRHPRVSVAVPAEVKKPLEGYVRRAQTTNVSEGGCYIEMLYTLEPMTRLEVVLWLNGEKVKARAEVVTNQPSLGNGIRFIQISDKDKQKLKEFLEVAKKTRAFPFRTATSGQS